MTRLLAIVTDAVEGPESIEAIRMGPGEAGDVEVKGDPAGGRGDAVSATRSATSTSRRARLGERLEVSLRGAAAQRHRRLGTVGDADPVLAAQDALREAPADEVVIFERAADQARWFETGSSSAPRRSSTPPLRMVVVSAGERRLPRRRRRGGRAGPSSRRRARESRSPTTCRASPAATSAGMVIGVVGTIVAIVLAAAGRRGPDDGGGTRPRSCIAIGVALVNMAHVVGAHAVRRASAIGAAGAFFRTLSLVGTPLAVLVNLILLLRRLAGGRIGARLSRSASSTSSASCEPSSGRSGVALMRSTTPSSSSSSSATLGG